MAVERAAAEISVVDIAFRVDCQMSLVLLSLSIRQHVQESSLVASDSRVRHSLALGMLLRIFCVLISGMCCLDQIKSAMAAVVMIARKASRGI